MAAEIAVKRKQPWQFTFQTDDLNILANDLKTTGRFFACLVCGRETVCLLDDTQLQKVVDLAAGSAQAVFVRIPKKGASMWVKGPKGDLPRAVPHKAFPDHVF